jgi:hypothetical protein
MCTRLVTELATSGDGVKTGEMRSRFRVLLIGSFRNDL